VDLLDNHIKTGKFARAYLLFGSEGFLMTRWRNALVQAISRGDAQMLDMNMDVFEGAISAETIINAAETMPFMADCRLIIVKSSGLFASGRSDDSAAMAEYVKDVPDTAVVLFVEADVDKRGRLYKRLADKSIGLTFEAATPKEPQLADWAVQYAASQGKKMTKAVGLNLIRTVSADMQFLSTEIAKLAAHAGDNPAITADDVAALCVKSIEGRIFELMRAIGNRDAKTACRLYGNLIALKESPLMILAMIARHFRFCLQCGALAQRMSQRDIAAKLSLQPFAVRDFIETSRNFSQNAMIAGLTDCLETDCAIKSGEIGDVIGVEVLIAKCCGY